MGENTGKIPSESSHIPPPTDPYVTYQTPYARKPSDEVQNPFIEFRRLADQAFSSFFSGLPRFLGTEQFKEANIRESDQAYVRTFDEHAKEFERRIAEMVQARAEEAEGLRKKLEQEWEERRRLNEKRMEEESQRWEMMRRGLEKCPGLRPDGVETKGEAESELDLYDGLRAYEAPAYKPRSEPKPMQTSTSGWRDENTTQRCPWNEEESTRNGWLSGLGWDGRRRAKNIALHVPHMQNVDEERQQNADWQEYCDEDMDPFNNDDHVVPWMKLSPYSPVSLIGKQAWSDTSVQSNEIPWDEAFEDLMMVHKTGKLPNLVRRLVYWGGPNQWMTDMVLRGSLGPKWEEGFMVAALMGAVEGNHWKGFNGLTELCTQLAGRAFKMTSSTSEMPECYKEEDANDFDDRSVYPGEWASIVREAFEPRVKEVYDQMEELAENLFGEARSTERSLGARGMRWPSPEEIIAAVVEGRAGAVPHEEIDNGEPAATAQHSWSSSAESTSSQMSAETDKAESLVSTFTTITTKTLPDGSTETKRVLRKRFADGSEENSESTETKPSQVSTFKDAITQTTTADKAKRQEIKPGWFWN